MATNLYTESVLLPLMNDVRVKLLSAIDQNDSYLEILLTIPDVVSDLQDQMLKMGNSDNKRLKMTASINELKSDDYTAMGKLMHGVSRNLLKSVIRGTVAYDYGQGKLSRFDCYGMNYPGTYVVSVGVNGTGGMFLTAKEMSRVASTLEMYAQAGDSYQKAGKKWKPNDPDAEKLRKHARAVEENYNKVDADAPPKFASSASEVASVFFLAQSMELRYTNMKKHNPTGNIRSWQAPLMVGCAAKTKIGDRMKAHDLPSNATSSSFTNTTHTWALLLCAMDHNRVSPEVFKMPLFVYYEPEQLAWSERVFSALGQSYVFQGGINVTQAGGTPGVVDTKLTFECAREVFVNHTWWMTNLQQTFDRIECLQNRARIHEHHTKRFDADGLPTRMIELETTVTEFETEVNKYVTSRQKLKKLVNEQKEKNRQMEESIQKMEDLLLIRERVDQWFQRQEEDSSQE